MRFGEPFGGIIPGPQGTVLSALLRTGTPLTGRQVHRLVSDRCSLGSVQNALAVLGDLGIVETRAVGRALVHSINEDHYSVPALRALLDPLAQLKTVVQDAVGPGVEAVVLFGSVARGEADASSDVDLAVIAPEQWTGRTRLQDCVRQRLGNACDVLVFTSPEFVTLASEGTEPVVADILGEGIVLSGRLPAVVRGGD